jgi:serine protease inhibitor
MKRLLIGAAIILAFVSCKKDGVSPAESKVLLLPAMSGTIINASNKTAFSLFDQVLSLNENNNTLISPLSIYMALGMVYNGADNATRDSIAKVLELSGTEVDNLNSTAKALIEQLPQEDNKVTFSIANSIWYRNNGVQPIQSFLDITEENYKATISPVDFSSPQAVTSINNWVSEKTKGKIDKLVDQVSGDDLMYLVNAIYFNGNWQYAFKPSDTFTDLFHISENNTVSIPFMLQEVTVRYASNEDFEMVELPYGSGKAFSMFIMLPKQAGIPINQFAGTLNESLLETAMTLLKPTKIRVIIPKWEYSYNMEKLKDQLTALGMGIAFSDNADFSKMYPAKVEITRAIHKTYIKVNEEGTEAAAATAVGIGLTAVQVLPAFKADHPFLYIIAEKQTGTILFTGILNDPSKN